MIIGRLDRPITIEQASLAQDAGGQEIQTWSTFHSCYARWQPMTATERFRAGGTHGTEAGKITIRYKTGILTTMRVLLEGKYFKITSISELTRRDGMELTLELWQ